MCLASELFHSRNSFTDSITPHFCVNSPSGCSIVTFSAVGCLSAIIPHVFYLRFLQKRQRERKTRALAMHHPRRLVWIQENIPLSHRKTWRTTRAYANSGGSEWGSVTLHACFYLNPITCRGQKIPQKVRVWVKWKPFFCLFVYTKVCHFSTWSPFCSMRVSRLL